jgi:hypothetical protein
MRSLSLTLQESKNLKQSKAETEFCKVNSLSFEGRFFIKSIDTSWKVTGAFLAFLS